MPKICTIEDCDEPLHGHGYCKSHLGRWQRHGDPLAGRRRPRYDNPVCEFDGCAKPSNARGLCQTHYQRMRKYGDASFTKLARDYGSGKDWYVGPQGYVVRYAGADHPRSVSGGMLYQHREVMADALGRAMESFENVHHINGDKTDNRLENLELWISGQPAGQRLTDHVAWCCDMLTGQNIRAALVLKPELAERLSVLRLNLEELENGS